MIGCALHALMRPPTTLAHLVTMGAQTMDSAVCTIVCMQWCWRTVPSYDGGMYVKQELVDGMGLTPQPPGVLVCGEGRVCRCGAS